MRWVGGHKMIVLSTYKVKNVHVEVGKVVKNGQNLVYVVFEWPLSLKYIGICSTTLKYNVRTS